MIRSIFNRDNRVAYAPSTGASSEQTRSAEGNTVDLNIKEQLAAAGSGDATSQEAFINGLINYLEGSSPNQQSLSHSAYSGAIYSNRAYISFPISEDVSVGYLVNKKIEDNAENVYFEGFGVRSKNGTLILRPKDNKPKLISSIDLNGEKRQPYNLIQDFNKGRGDPLCRFWDLRDGNSAWFSAGKIEFVKSMSSTTMSPFSITNENLADRLYEAMTRYMVRIDSLFEKRRSDSKS